MSGDDDIIPTIGTYRGVGLHDRQSTERLTVVRRAIDGVFAVSDPRELLKIAERPCWPPEARLLAAAMLEAKMQIAADERAVRPNIDLAYVRACVAGVNSVKWRHPTHFGSLLDHSRMGGEDAVRRDEPLDR